MQDQPREIRTEDEVSLYEVYRIIVRRKFTAFVIFFFVMFVTVAYLVFTDPVYEAKARILPSMDDRISLTQPEHPYGTYDALDLFLGFHTRLRMIEQWREFVSLNSELFPSFDNGASRTRAIEHPVQIVDNKNHVLITYQDSNPESSAEILRRYIQHAHKQYVENLVSVLKDKIESQKAGFLNDIEMMRKTAILAREDSIDRLRRDLALANSLGIRDYHHIQLGKTMQNGAVVILDTGGGPNYLRGTRFLSQELESLLKRDSDDAYILGLRDKQIKLERLNTLRFVPENLRAYTQDGEIFAPQLPIKPRIWTLIVLSTILGLVLALFGTVVAEFAARNSRTDVVQH